MSHTLMLPWPPSVNTYYRHISKGTLAGRTLISRDGRNYRATVAGVMLSQRVPKHIGRLAVRIDAYAPDRRARDMDNLTKGLLDALTHAGVWADDSQIDDLRIVRGPCRGAPGCVVVSIAEVTA